jgi:hypothetical protein
MFFENFVPSFPEKKVKTMYAETRRWLFYENPI